MPFTLAGHLAGKAPAARLNDPLGIVAENLRLSPQGILPVFAPEDLAQRRVIGLVSQVDLERASAPLLEPVASLNGHAAAYLEGHLSEDAPRSPQEILRSMTARDVMQRDVPFVPAQFSLLNVLLTLDRYGVTALPVLDARGEYRGMITRADVLSALTGSVKPPVVGGMATPLGVWLTDGRLTGGAPQIGLFLSGLTMAACYAVAQVAVIFIARLLNPEWGSLAASGRLGMALDGTGLVNTTFFLLQSLIFFGLFKLLPISGIHAAEHQTVHAMERGLPLTVENVARMPRAHPRCGTNLTAIVGIMLIGITHVPSYDPEWILPILVVTYFTWRSFGDMIQTVFTTRTPTRKQIESGIKAANELMERYQAQPFVVNTSPLRILNQGMILAAAGMMSGMFLFLWLLDRLAS